MTRHERSNQGVIIRKTKLDLEKKAPSFTKMVIRDKTLMKMHQIHELFLAKPGKMASGYF